MVQAICSVADADVLEHKRNCKTCWEAAKLQYQLRSSSAGLHLTVSSCTVSIDQIPTPPVTSRVCPEIYEARGEARLETKPDQRYEFSDLNLCSQENSSTSLI